jgi:chaperone modulatory protein CbpM
MARAKQGHAAEIVGAEPLVSLDELSRAAHVEVEWVAELVSHGVIVPSGATRTEWRFADVSVIRLAKARRLRHDLDLNTAGVALALELLDEIDTLRAELRRRG